MNALISEILKIDDENDCVYIGGQKVHGAVIREFTRVTPKDQWFRILKIEHGAITVRVRLFEHSHELDDEGTRWAP